MAGWSLNGDKLFKNSTTPATIFSLRWLSYVIAVVIAVVVIIVALDVICFAPQLLRSGGARSLHRESG